MNVRYLERARWWADQGYVALVLDSFGSRGIPENWLTFNRFGGNMRAADAVAAVRYLRGRDGVDLTRINGIDASAARVLPGVAAVYTADDIGALDLEMPLLIPHPSMKNARTQRPLARGEGFAFDLEIRRGAGAYICGEETAIFNSIEGFRGEPRSKPPFPVEQGVFRKPTAINNVETLVNVLGVLDRGGPDYAGTGTEGSTGTKLFCVSGCITRPGVYETAFGGTLRGTLTVTAGLGGMGGAQPLAATNWLCRSSG